MSAGGAAAAGSSGVAAVDASLPAALPSFFELVAPHAWRMIDFVSDLHLAPGMPRTFEAWERHLLDTPADAVVVLGDLFELWVGDDMRSAAFERRCVELLAAASSRHAVAIMVGNRDFLLGSSMLRDCGATGLPDPTLLVAWGRRLLLTHGDALCLADTPYMAFRREVRSPRWQESFLARPLAERLNIAREIRRASQSRRAFDGNPDADIDAAEAMRWMRSQGVAEMIHGHTHRPGSATLAPGFCRHVLSDWDLDSPLPAPPRAEVLRLTREGLARLPPCSR
jgi:UDP-2,3-diacylglucosamine hydrolase